MSPVPMFNPGGEYLSVLLDGIASIDAVHNPFIDEICLDSRKVRPGSLFCAVPGLKDDGRDHIDQAIARGARAVVFDSNNWTARIHDEVPQIAVPNLARQLSKIADIYYQQPSLKLHVVGITGTNGKSSCALLTAQALGALGKKCAVVGTLGWGWPDQLEPLPLTTPDSISLQHYLAALADASAEQLCLEVSSHSLDQGRTDGIRFGTVVLTNLSQDHLDYHKNAANYRAAKAKLFTDTAASHAVLNVDDDFGRTLLGQTSAAREITYGEQRADVQLTSCVSNETGLALTLNIDGQQIAVQSGLRGRINGINLTTVAAILHSLGYSKPAIESVLPTLNPIAGRLEQLPGSPDQPAVFVDYAHTPDALEQALLSLREITRGKLKCVFGCGGDRDRDKRSLMGAIAERLADDVIITDDNPRTEAPEQITNQIAAGMKRPPTIEHDRRQAIGLAITESQADDVVLIAGKGHETVQIYADKTHPFSDREAAESILGGSQC